MSLDSGLVCLGARPADPNIMSAKRFKLKKERQADLVFRDELRTSNVELPTLNGEEISAVPKQQEARGADLHSPDAGGARDKAPPVVEQERSNV